MGWTIRCSVNVIEGAYDSAVTLTRDDLAGYVERDLDADLARWFADRPLVTVPEETRPVAPFLERLAPASAAALSAFAQSSPARR